MRTSPSNEPPERDAREAAPARPPGDGGAPRGRPAADGPPAGRLTSALRVLDPDQRFAALAALALAGSLFLPWWRDPFLGVTSVAVRRLTFIECALFLVAAAVLVMLLGRAERRTFHLPLSDGTLTAAAGAWALVLVTFRVLDPPSRTAVGEAAQVTSDYGLRWGAYVALVAATALVAAGVRVRRRRHHGEPEAVAADADATATLELPR